MMAFILGVAALVLTNLLTDHEARREGFDDLRGGVRIGA